MKIGPIEFGPIKRFRLEFGRGKAFTSLPPSEDWAVGDVAICVGSGEWFRWSDSTKSNGPQKGECNAVKSILKYGNLIALVFAEYDGAFTAHNFRKVSPKADKETRADKAFIKRLRTIKPVSVPELETEDA